jgi:two-component system sensor histidine kinase VicK
LFQALDQRAVSLQATVDKTQNEKRMNQQVLFLVNQELRTSLVSATRYLSQFMEAEQAALNQKQTQSLELAQKSLDEINQINQTMKFLQEANAGIESTRLNMVALLQSAVEHCSISAELAKINLELHLPNSDAFVAGDSNQIFAVLDALLSNAIKLGREGGQVTATLHPPTDGMIRVTVANDGVGVSQNKLDKIFTPFARSDSSPIPEYHGLGIGLALVKEVVEEHGGKVWADSKVRKGIAFQLTLPETT